MNDGSPRCPSCKVLRTMFDELEDAYYQQLVQRTAAEARVKELEGEVEWLRKFLVRAAHLPWKADRRRELEALIARPANQSAAPSEEQA
jgi:hypothetical protein